ncbi:MAG: hypothetical protein LQ342_006378 [Letrouitia transgressa]|nr:MAG: hypothetical protein LQ342_006378 [Letrouitia transgressa]
MAIQQVASFNSTTTGKEVVKLFASQANGKVVLITGASKGGLGAETALALATGSPKKIVLTGRSEAKVAPVLQQVKDIDSKIETQFVTLELGDRNSVRKAAAEVNSSNDKIDILINNAGIMAVENYVKNADGIESQFSSNHLGPFLFTNLIASKLGQGSRVVNVTSMGYEASGIRFDDYNFQEGKTYNPWYAYGQSKTANILFAHSLAEKLAKKGAQAYVIHPGLITSSNLMNNVSQEMFMDGWKIAVEANGGKPVPMEEAKPLEAGCSTALVAALDPALKSQSGAFLRDCNLVTDPLKPHASDPKAAEGLWSLSEQIIGEKFNL